MRTRVGELVHHDFGDEAALRVARRAHRALQSGVDVDVGVRAAAIGEDVDVRQRKARAGAGAAGAPRLRVEERQHAVGGDARLDLCKRRRPVAGREVLFLAIEHQLDRRVGGLRETRADQALRIGGELAAEAAAHELGDHANVGLRDLEAGGEALARAVHRLRRDPRREVLAVPFADAAVRLERRVRLHLRRVGAFDRVRRGLQTGVDIAFFFGIAGARVVGLEDLRRFGTHRLLDGREVGQDLPFDANQPDGVFGLLLGERGNRRNFLAGEHHLLAGLDGRHRRSDAGGFLRRCDVDALDARVRMRRSQDLAVDHAGPRDVV